MLSDPSDTSGSLQHIKSAFTSTLLCCLMQTPVLQILSKLQRSLDILDIEGLSSLWRRTLLSHPSLSSESLPAIPLGVSSPFLSSPEPDIVDWETFIDSFLSPFSSGLDHLQPKVENIRYYLLAYLLSGTVKDCSIIVRTDLLQLGKTSTKRKNTDSVMVIDLDPRKMERLNKWEKLDAEIVNAYSNNGGGKICIDAWREWDLSLMQSLGWRRDTTIRPLLIVLYHIVLEIQSFEVERNRLVVQANSCCHFIKSWSRVERVPRILWVLSRRFVFLLNGIQATNTNSARCHKDTLWRQCRLQWQGSLAHFTRKRPHNALTQGKPMELRLSNMVAAKGAASPRFLHAFRCLPSF